MDTLYRDAKGASPKEFQLIDLIIVASQALKYESTCSSVYGHFIQRCKGGRSINLHPLRRPEKEPLIMNGLSIE